MAEVEVRNAEDKSRYEASIGGKLAGIVEYMTNGSGVLIFVHTEVVPEFEGRGVAAKLVHDALVDVRARGLKLTPICPYVAAYVKRHPDEAADILS